jgi:hypothetical protein
VQSVVFPVSLAKTEFKFVLGGLVLVGRRGHKQQQQPSESKERGKGNRKWKRVSGKCGGKAVV